MKPHEATHIAAAVRRVYEEFDTTTAPDYVRLRAHFWQLAEAAATGRQIVIFDSDDHAIALDVFDTYARTVEFAALPDDRKWYIRGVLNGLGGRWE